MTIIFYKRSFLTACCKKILVIFAGLFFLTNNNYAQTLQQRQQIKKVTDIRGLDSLRTDLGSKRAADEMAVQSYLAVHPLAKRYFEQNSIVYFLQRIDKEGNPVYINTKNRASGEMISANQLYTDGTVGANVTGTGMVAGIWDGGQVRATHELLVGKVTMQAGQTLNSVSGNNHMTHVSGTIVGSDIANQPSARGIAYNATAQNYDWDNDKAEMTTFAANSYLISNHSYGYANDNTTPLWTFGAYDVESKAWDAITKAAPYYLPFVAAGNEQSSNGNMTKAGYDLITGSSAAKNVMTVGALNGDSTMSDYSNWGPTDDGRFKPEVVAKGTGINSSIATGDQAYSGNGVASSGTSYATPAVAATALLLQQYYHNLTGNYMMSSTLKALMLHTATDLGNPGPDYKFGWGLINAEKAGFAIKWSKTLSTTLGTQITEMSTNPPNDGNNEISTTFVSSGTEPVKISVAWLDDDGTEQTAADGIDPITGRLVYTFDILVRDFTAGGDTRPWQPMGMINRTANATKATGWFQGDNDNYRQVVINNPGVGHNYRIYFRKSTASPAAVRPISLIITGIQVPAPTATLSTQSVCAGATLAELTVTGYNIKWYDAASAGNVLPLTTPLVNGSIYYASQTGTSESVSRKAITASVSGSTLSLPATNQSVTAAQTDSTKRYTTAGCTALITTVKRSGAAPLTGSVTANVWIESTAPATFVKRHYQITPATNAATSTGTVTLFFTQAEFDAYNAVNTNKLPSGPSDAAGINKLLIQKYPGTSSDGSGLPATYTGTPIDIDPVDNNIIWNTIDNRWEVTFDANGFSGFFVKTLSVLPLNWLNVSANLNTQKQAYITWEIEETGIAKYELQKSMDGANFISLATIPGSGDGHHYYNYTDKKVFDNNSTVTYYRIRQVDNNGGYSFSKILSVKNNTGLPVTTVYPNPAQHIIYIEATDAQDATICNSTGVSIMAIHFKAGITTINVEKLTSGIYFIHTSSGNVIKFVKL